MSASLIADAEPLPLLDSLWHTLTDEEKQEIERLKSEFEASLTTPPAEPAPVKLTIDMLAERHISKEIIQSNDQAKIHDALLSVKRLSLDRLSLGSVEHLELFTQATQIYLQYNQLRTVEGLECMPQLQFLALFHNRISRLADLRLGDLSELLFLDLSFNDIEELTQQDIDSLPRQIRTLNLEGNGCVHSLEPQSETLRALLRRLSNLQKLNNQDIDAELRDECLSEEQRLKNVL